MDKATIGFGPHLMLDLYGCNKTKLNDKEFIYRLLDELPAQINMTKITPPQLTPYPGKEGSFDKGGISGFVLIAESHISIHTFVAQEHAFIDIFSCKPFDIEKAKQLLTTALEAKKIDEQITNRGLEFPKDIAASDEIIQEERQEHIV